MDRKETFSQLLLASTLVSSAPGISLGLTKPDLALVYEGNEIPAPGGTAAGALGRPAIQSLVTSTSCHVLSPAWGRASQFNESAFSVRPISSLSIQLHL